MALDIGYFDREIFDEDSFVLPGPGAVRGLRLLGYEGRWAKCVVELQGQLGAEFQGLLDRKQELVFHDRQATMCAPMPSSVCMPIMHRSYYKYYGLHACVCLQA